MDSSSTSSLHQPKLLDRLRTALLMHGTTPERTESFIDYSRAFIRFHGLRHPDTLGEAEIGAFLNHLACERCLPLSEQAAVLQAILFLYYDFLHREFGHIPVSYVPLVTNRIGPSSTSWPTSAPVMSMVLRVRTLGPLVRLGRGALSALSFGDSPLGSGRSGSIPLGLLGFSPSMRCDWRRGA